MEKKMAELNWGKRINEERRIQYVCSASRRHHRTDSVDEENIYCTEMREEAIESDGSDGVSSNRSSFLTTP